MQWRRGIALLALAACSGGGGSADESAGPTSASTSTGTTSTGVTSAGPSSSDETTGSIKYDIAMGDLSGCPGGGEITFSNAWLNNSLDNTVSKVNTMEVVEEARYRVFPDAQYGGKPHLTSVNLAGDVAVANSCSLGMGPTPDCGGVTKIAAELEDCVDIDNDMSITTSSGPNDVELFGEDECVLWHRTLPGVNWPVAWTSGQQQDCSWIGMKLWTGTTDENGESNVYLLDGDDGSIEQTVPIPEVTDPGFLYAAAVDSENDLWVAGIVETLVQVDFDTMQHDVIAAPHQMRTILVDASDRVWSLDFTTLSRYDPGLDTWDSMTCSMGPGQCRLVAQEEDGNIWVAIAGGDPALLVVDADTMDVLDQIDAATFPGYSGSPAALGFDAEGYLWLVAIGSDAFKVETEQLTFDLLVKDVDTGLMHSDFTGFGLMNVAEG